MIADCGLSEQSTHLLAVGPHGLAVTVPDGVTVLPVGRAVQLGGGLSAEEQQRIVAAALAAPASGPPLKELAKGHRRAVVVAGDLLLPAPYDVALPPVIGALLEAEIRPTRIVILAWPGRSGPVLGRAAIHRYGEEVVGEYDLRAWQGGGAQPDSFYAAADLRVAVAPALPWSTLPDADMTIRLGLGGGPRLEIASATAGGRREAQCPTPDVAECDVALATGGGAAWEATLEEALLSLHVLLSARPRAAKTAVLAFSGDEGLGSAHFTRDLWSLFEQADELLARGGALIAAPSAFEEFEPVMAVAQALGSFEHLVLFAPGLAGHEEGGDLAACLEELRAVAGRVHLCAREPELWELLRGLAGPGYRLSLHPLGWREACAAE